MLPRNKNRFLTIYLSPEYYETLEQFDMTLNNKNHPNARFKRYPKNELEYYGFSQGFD